MAQVKRVEWGIYTPKKTMEKQKEKTKTKCIFCNGTGCKTNGVCSNCDGFGYYYE